MLHFALIGHPLSHSLSPLIHSFFFKKSGVLADYSLIDIPPSSLPGCVSQLSQLSGFNVTIPHKSEIIKQLDYVCEKSKLYGAVNTVKLGSKKEGYNTDSTGFLQALDFAGLSLTGSVLVCGAGGVSRMLAFESALHGCNVTIATRTQGLNRAAALQSEIKSRLGKHVSTCTYEEISGTFDLLLNGTPVGMHPNTQQMVVTPAVLENCRQVFDTVYNPTQTKLITNAKALGIPCDSGMHMLAAQAAAAQEIWTGARFTSSDIAAAAELARRELEAQ